MTAVFSLVSVFCCTSGLRITLQREFRALTFLRVYVGAMAVLFLFVVRRLNIQPSEQVGRRAMPVVFVVAGVFLFMRHGTLTASRGWQDPSRGRARGGTDWMNVLDRMTDRESLGQMLYTHYWVLFLTAGLMLLTARVGAISLVRGMPTGAEVDAKRQQVHQQISRDASRAVFLTTGLNKTE